MSEPTDKEVIESLRSALGLAVKERDDARIERDEQACRADMNEHLLDNLTKERDAAVQARDGDAEAQDKVVHDLSKELAAAKEGNNRLREELRAARPWKCFRCDDAATPLYCLNCAEKLLASKQP